MTANVWRMPRVGGRPNNDRVMVSFYIGRATKADIEKVALGLRVPQADVYRTLLEDGLQRIKDGKLKL